MGVTFWEGWLIREHCLDYAVVSWNFTNVPLGHLPHKWYNAGLSNKIASNRACQGTQMNKAESNAKLVKVKLELAAKCDRLAKTSKSTPKRNTMLYHAAQFRRQAADFRGYSTKMESLEGHLLVASPQLLDPNFARALVLLIEHNQEGAFGVVVNHPVGKTLQELWREVGSAPCHSRQPIY